MRFNSKERRRSPRLRLQIPLFIRGQDASGAEFVDLSKTLDISETGAFLVCSRKLRSDRMLRLTIPAPSPTPSGSLPSETPPIRARVLRQKSAGDLHLVGVEFLKALE